jgi:hypothetical protein
MELAHHHLRSPSRARRAPGRPGSAAARGRRWR